MGSPCRDRRRVCEREAADYDQKAKPPDGWLLVSGGREWICAHADGKVLEIAVGTGLNLPHYADEFDSRESNSCPRCWTSPAGALSSWVVWSICGWRRGGARVLTPPSTRWSARCRCIRSRTTAPPGRSEPGASSGERSVAGARTQSSPSGPGLPAAARAGVASVRGRPCPRTARARAPRASRSGRSNAQSSASLSGS
jgi:hypothetical protein